MRINNPSRWMRRAVVTIAAVITVVGLGSVLSVTLAGKFGNVALGMKTGSMRPSIDPGDLVIVREVDPQAIHPGDTITFRRPGEPNEIYTHRVASVTYGQQTVSFHTKGDANPVEDPWTVSYTGPAWKVTHVVRDGGYVLMVTQSRIARELIAASIFVLSLALLWPVIVDPRQRRGETGSTALAGAR